MIQIGTGVVCGLTLSHALTLTGKGGPNHRDKFVGDLGAAASTLQEAQTEEPLSPTMDNTHRSWPVLFC